VVTTLVVLLAAGCGSDDDSETGTGGTTDTTADSVIDDSMTDDSMTADSVTDDSVTAESMDEEADEEAMAAIQVIDTPFGPALGDGEGYVLYTWDDEADGSIQCVDEACVAEWPPHLADEIVVSDDVDADLFSLVERPDGTMQLAVDGRPLYRMAIDTPGEVNCQGGGGWWIVDPDGSKNTSTTPV
jgi:predicted lipoprotein with Yx(FWY)xxD motif